MNPEDYAEQILKDSWDLSLPVDPVLIARKMGIKTAVSTDITTSGQLVEIGANQYKILLREEPAYRQRFTAAHELGHAVLGHGARPRVDNYGYSLFNFDPVERDANQFTAALIMPRIAVEHFIDTDSDLPGMVTRFGVSGQAMQIRLERLGLL
jgi:Zn-dependent peptidase ImmA (M78 family)